MRRWVWGKVGSHSVTREVIPFWGYTFLGLAFSTVVVAAVDRWWQSAVAVSLANIGAFGLLWISKFLFLDAWMFADRDAPDRTRMTDDGKCA
jgi:integral membrane sensor domain MASE1